MVLNRNRGKKHRPRTREEALELNWNHYYPDEPCPRGHKTHYVTELGICADCRIEDFNQFVKDNPFKKHKFRRGK